MITFVMRVFCFRAFLPLLDPVHPEGGADHGGLRSKGEVRKWKNWCTQLHSWDTWVRIENSEARVTYKMNKCMCV